MSKNSKKTYSKLHLKIPLNDINVDTSFCIAHCSRECARKQIPIGVCTLSDFTEICLDFKKCQN